VLTNLVKLKQYPIETLKQYLDIFMEARGKYWFRIHEKKFIMITQQGLEWELRKKFARMKFKYIYELGARVSRYKSLLREEVEEKILIYRTIVKKQ